MTGRITIEAEKRSGQPCIRGLRITVWDVLSWLAAGMTEQEILDDYPDLERSDFQAVYEFAASMGRRVALWNLLFDENLSRKLVGRLGELYPESAHVADFDLLQRSDREIWEFARTKAFILVSTDADFFELATTLAPPPKVIWLRRWRDPTKDAELVLQRDALRIAEFANDPELGVLVLNRE